MTFEEEMLTSMQQTILDLLQEEDLNLDKVRKTLPRLVYNITILTRYMEDRKEEKELA